MDNGASSYRRFLDGDKNAFGEIVDELMYGLIYFINSYVHDFHTAEDIAMDVLADLIANRHRYNFKVKLKTYLYMVARSRALDCLKHRKVYKQTELSEEIEASDDISQLEKAVLTSERRRALSLAMSQLPQDMREALHLVYFEEMSYDEASKVMKKSKKQLDNLLYRGKKELFVLLGEEGKQLI